LRARVIVGSRGRVKDPGRRLVHEPGRH
jgi:hypothetical protein